MAIVLPAEKKPKSFISSLLGGVGASLPALLQQMATDKKGKAQAQKELDLLEKKQQYAKELVSHKEQEKANAKRNLYEELGLLPKQGQNTPFQGQMEQSQDIQGMTGGGILSSLIGQLSPGGQNQEDEIGSLMDMLSSQMPQQNIQQTPSKPDLTNLSDDQLMLLAMENPGLANTLIKGKEFKQRQQLQEDKFKFQRDQSDLDREFKQTEADKKRTHEIHKYSEKFYDEVQDAAETAKKQIMAINIADKAVSSGNVHPSSFASIFRGVGKHGDKIADYFTNGDQASLKAVTPYLIEGMKDVFGVRLSDADLQVVKDKLPDLGKTPEANKAILNIFKKYARISEQKGKIANDLMRANGGYRGLNFRADVNEKLDEWMKGEEPVRVKLSNGKVWKVPKNELNSLMNDDPGAKVLNE